MNVFYLHHDVNECAKMHCDKHVVKMILETTQLLSTTHHITEQIPEFPIYRKTHSNHPSAVWARKSIDHYKFLVSLGLALCREYTKRYGKTHKSQEILENMSKYSINLPNNGFEPPPQAMPDKYKNKDTVKAYRDYYIGEKFHILQYKTEMPDFVKRIWNEKV